MTTQRMERNDVERILQDMEVDGWPGVYVLGCLDVRVTVYSQQVRALNLAVALIESGHVNKGDAVVVVGAGAAGLTCAAGLRQLGAEVTVLEKQSQILQLFRGSSQRWLHPGVYDWPLDGWDRHRAGLPLLDWEHGMVNDVLGQLETGWAAVVTRGGVDLRCSATRIHLGEPGDEPRTVIWQPHGQLTAKAVILAVGFGLEPTEPRYWEDDRLDARRVDSKRRTWLVSGCGDGALTDLLRLCLGRFQHDRMLDEFTGDPRMQTVREEILRIEANAKIQNDPKELHKAYAELEAPWVVEAMRKRRREDTTVMLNAPTAYFLTRGASVLNRFLVGQLFRAELFDRIPGRLLDAPALADGGVVVRIADRPDERFDAIVRRHGPVPALREDFPAIAKVLDAERVRRRAKATLSDQTRRRYWREDAFDANPAAVVASPVDRIEVIPAPAAKVQVIARPVHDRHLDDRELIFISFAGQRSRVFKDEIKPFFRGKKVVWTDENLDAGDWKEQIIDHLEHCRGAIALVDKHYLSGEGFVEAHEIPILLRRAFSNEIPLVPILASSCSSRLDQEFEVRAPDGTSQSRSLTELTWAPKGIPGHNGLHGPKATPLGDLTESQRDRYYDDAARLISDWPGPVPPPPLPLATDDADELIASLTRASAPLLEWPTTIQKTWIDRPEATLIMERMESSPSSTTLLLGLPGSGKSALLAHIAERVAKRGWTVLGIKADYLLPTVCSPADLAKALSLDGDPIAIVRRVASAERPCLIALDQLDVLSSFVERHAERLEVLLNLAASAHELPYVHVLSSCRIFEYNYDPRLRGLDPQPIHLELPPLDEALEVLRRETTLAPDAANDLEILRNPQYLKLVVINASRLTSLPEAVSSQTFLSEIIKRTLSQAAIEAGMGLANRMGERETLWCGEQEAGLPSLQELSDTGFIVRENGRIRFAHQVIFEHLWARFMVLQGVSKVVLEGEQSLLARPRIRNALEYLRSLDPVSFHTEVDALWASPGLQYHIRRLLIDVVAHIGAPCERDLRWIRDRLQEDAWHVYTFRRLSSVAWFNALLPDDLPALMEERRFNGDGLATILHAAIRSRPRDVARLLRDHWLRAEYISKVQWMVESLPWAEPWTRELWRELASFAEYEPEILCGHLRKVEDHHGDAADLVARRMGTALDSVFFSNSESRRDINHVLFSQNWAHASEIVARAPGQFLDRLWPQLQQALEGYGTKPVWGGYHGGAIGHRFDAQHHRMSMIATLRLAICELARQDPSGFIALVRSRLRSRSADLHQMVGEGLDLLAESRPAFVVEYLTKESERLHIWSWDSKPWISRQLVTVAGLHATDHDLTALEEAILKLAPAEQSMRRADEPDDQRLEWWRSRDLLLKLWLLEVIPEKRLSHKALEWKANALREAGTRRWSSEKTARPELVPVPSPVDRAQFLAMAPKEIIETFRELHDATGHHPHERGMGGSVEASREFAAAMKEAPERAPAVFRNFEPGKQERPAALTLQAWAEAKRADLVVEWARYFDERGFRTREFRADVANALYNIFKHQGIDDNSHQMLLRWLDQWDVETKEEVTPVDHEIERPLCDNHHGWSISQGSWSVLNALLTGLLGKQPPAIHEALDVLRRHSIVIYSPSALASLGAESLPMLVNGDRIATVSIMLDLLEARPHLLYAPESIITLIQLRSHDPTLSERLHQLLLNVKRGPWEAGPQLWAEVSAMTTLSHGLDWAHSAVSEIINDKEIEHSERQIAGVIHTAGQIAADGECAPEHIKTAVRWLVALAPRVPPALRSAWMVPLDRQRYSKVSTMELLPLLRAAAVHFELLGAADEDVLEIALEVITDEPSLAFGVAHGFLAARHSQGQRVILRGNAMKSIITVLQRTPHHRYNAIVLMESLLKHDAYGAEQFLVELERD